MFEHLTTGELLARWRAELIMAGTVQEQDWDRHGPAADAALQDAQQRLRRALPPSYREFLSLSDGWPMCGPFVNGLRTASDVGWFRDLEAEWYQIWRDGSLEHDPDDPGFDVTLLGRALVVSEPGEQALLLDPQDVDPETGEWACYTFSNWAPGSHEVGPSFRSGLEQLYRDFIAFNDVPSVTEAESGGVVERAYQAMLAGDLTARALLDDQVLLNWRAWALAAQFDLFGAAPHSQDSSISVQHLWWGQLRGKTEQEALTDDVVLNELVPMWVSRLVETQRAGIDWELLRAPEALRGRMRELLAQISDGTGPIADFSYCPRFSLEIDAARAQIAAGDLEAAWQTVLAALPIWTPMSPDHLAPVGLYFDKDLRRLLTPPPPPSPPPAPRPAYPPGGLWDVEHELPPELLEALPPEWQSDHGQMTSAVWVRGSASEPPSPPARLTSKLHSDRTLTVLAVPYRPN